jgi:hypothetical protein
MDAQQGGGEEERGVERLLTEALGAAHVGRPLAAPVRTLAEAVEHALAAGSFAESLGGEARAAVDELLAELRAPALEPALAEALLLALRDLLEGGGAFPWRRVRTPAVVKH